MSSVYSLPDRQRFENIPLKDLNQPQQNQHIERMERIEYNQTKKKNRKYKWSIYALGALLFLTTILTLVFAGLYISHRSALPETPTNGTVPASTVTTTTSIHAPTTTVITKTLALTTTDTSSVTVTQSSKPKRCYGNQLYGGQELHDINSDYDLLLVDAMETAVSQGLDIGDAKNLEVALRSVFICVNSPSIELVAACKSMFEHQGDGMVVCNSFGSYPYQTTSTTTSVTVTGTSWVTVTPSQSK